MNYPYNKPMAALVRSMQRFSAGTRPQATGYQPRHSPGAITPAVPPDINHPGACSLGPAQSNSAAPFRHVTGSQPSLRPGRNAFKTGAIHVLRVENPNSSPSESRTLSCSGVGLNPIWTAPPPK